METTIVNPGSGPTCAIGEIDKFYDSRLSHHARLFRNARRNRRRDQREGWLHTGDISAMDARTYCPVEMTPQEHDHPRKREYLYARHEELLFRHPKVGEVR